MAYTAGSSGLLFVGSPCEKVLKAGDEVLALMGKSVVGLKAATEIVKSLRGTLKITVRYAPNLLMEAVGKSVSRASENNIKQMERIQNSIIGPPPAARHQAFLASDSRSEHANLVAGIGCPSALRFPPGLADFVRIFCPFMPSPTHDRDSASSQLTSASDPKICTQEIRSAPKYTFYMLCTSSLTQRLTTRLLQPRGSRTRRRQKLD